MAGDPGLGDLGVRQLRDRPGPVGHPVQHAVVERHQHPVGGGVHVGLQVAVAEVDRLLEGDAGCSPGAGWAGRAPRRGARTRRTARRSTRTRRPSWAHCACGRRLARTARRAYRPGSAAASSRPGGAASRARRSAAGRCSRGCPQVATKATQNSTCVARGQARKRWSCSLNQCISRWAHSNSLDQTARPSSTRGMPPGPGIGPLTKPRQIRNRPAMATPNRYTASLRGFCRIRRRHRQRSSSRLDQRRGGVLVLLLDGRDSPGSTADGGSIVCACRAQRQVALAALGAG